MKLKIKTIDYHRNGVFGEGFHIVLFDWKDNGKARHMMGVVFKEPGCCAVLDADETAAGNVAFAQGNSWRGDHFEGQLREAITAKDATR